MRESVYSCQLRTPVTDHTKATLSPLLLASRECLCPGPWYLALNHPPANPTAQIFYPYYKNTRTIRLVVVVSSGLG